MSRPGSAAQPEPMDTDAADEEAEEENSDSLVAGKTRKRARSKRYKTIREEVLRLYPGMTKQWVREKVLSLLKDFTRRVADTVVCEGYELCYDSAASEGGGVLPRLREVGEGGRVFPGSPRMDPLTPTGR